MSVRISCFLVLAILGLAGCAENAILELEVDMPASTSDEPQYLVLLMRSARSSDFETDWGADELEGFELGAVSREETISVVAQPEDFGDDLLVRARFCSSPRCDALGDDLAGERRLVVETPFYSLKRTEATWVIGAVEDAVVETPDVVERCQVRGCREGTTAMYCSSDGPHFCE
ncbi:MAG: hypothetical protein CMN30_06320 [Sandaracinus sp.]|nr:hypothetical protein [Sandaracinus sp.]